MYKFFGYRRPNGTVGIRNYVGVIPAINCLNKMAKIIENRVNGTISFCHIGRCDYLGSDRDTVMKTLIGLGKNPNLGAIIVLGVGCENTSGSKIAAEIKKTGKQVVEINLNNEESFKEALNKAVEVCAKLYDEISNYKRVEVDLSEMVLAIKCGGSDATSGILGNVITGKIADLIINARGTVIFTENVEIIGAEHVLAKRAINKKVAKRILNVAKKTEDTMKVMGVDIRGSEPTPGNIKGGLTTIEEKSLGAIIKSGTKPIKEVIDWGQKPNVKGLFYMDGPSNTIEVFTGCASAGAQILLFSMGGGLPAKLEAVPSCAYNFPIMPIVKTTGNPKNYKRVKQYFDLYFGELLYKELSFNEVTINALKKIIKIASGDKSKLENLGKESETISFYTKGPII